MKTYTISVTYVDHMTARAANLGLPYTSVITANDTQQAIRAFQERYHIASSEIAHITAVHRDQYANRVLINFAPEAPELENTHATLVSWDADMMSAVLRLPNGTSIQATLAEDEFDPHLEGVEFMARVEGTIAEVTIPNEIEPEPTTYHCKQCGYTMSAKDFFHGAANYAEAECGHSHECYAPVV